MRQLGTLLHISSLETEYGIGDFGPAAYRFAEHLSSKGFSLWQILPINHCGYGNSPYNPISAFAISPYLISPELLYKEGLVSLETLNEAKLPSSDTVFYESVYKAKDKLLNVAAKNWLLSSDVESFIEDNAYTIKPYIAFQLLSRIYDDNAWQAWNTEHRSYNEALYNQLWEHYSSDMKIIAALQCIARDQVMEFKKILKRHNILLVGDIPLYLSYESAEVWAYQHFFDLDPNGVRLHFAGVPPDAFAEAGQLWGNPIYNWDKIKEDGFKLFLKRISQCLEYADLLRLDHFIGYVNYWCVDPDYSAEGTPITPKNATNGKWVPAYPIDFFTALCSKFGKDRIIAEDLGVLNDDVCKIRDTFGFPGMIVLQFCFLDSVPQIHQFPANRWLYTGTHDNPTLKGWFTSLDDDSEVRSNIRQYCIQNKDCRALPTPDNIHKIMMNIAISSSCETIIIPYQDIMGLDDNARMNIPGTALGNWQWRICSQLELL